MKHRLDGRKRIKLAIGAVIAVILLIGAYTGGSWLENRVRKPEPRGNAHQRYTYETMLEYDGVSYRRRNGLTTVLLMGIDKEVDGGNAAGSRNGGQADFLRLVVVDHAAQCVSQMAIDRDTMTPITILGVLGDRSGIRTAQICLSHAFGDGKAMSCELAAEAVSNLLYGTPVDYYLAMNLDGIAALNDALGGVTVTLKDDFSAFDPAMMEGATLQLTGEQAELFVRSRMQIGKGTNEARMARQEEYLNRAMALMDEQLRQDSETFADKLYDALEPYLTTNLSRGRFINEVWSARQYERAEIIRPTGVHRIGQDGFMQFHVDEDALNAIVLKLFYEPTEP